MVRLGYLDPCYIWKLKKNGIFKLELLFFLIKKKVFMRIFIKFEVPLCSSFWLQDHRKFQQRYYEFTDYFRLPDGPIFLKICGESSCDGIANDYIGVSNRFSRPLFFFHFIRSKNDIQF